MVAAVRQRDWTALDGVAGVAAGGDASAAHALARLRTAAAADELHASLGPALAAGAANAAQWLIARRGEPVQNGSGSERDQGDLGGTGTQPRREEAPGDGRTTPLTDPDAVDLAGLDDRLAAVASEVRAELAANPGRRVVITWRLR